MSLITFSNVKLQWSFLLQLKINQYSEYHPHYEVSSPAVEVCGLLPVELTSDRAAVLGGSESLEAVVDQLGVLFVEVFMGHDIRGAGVHLAAPHLRSRDEAR